MIRAAEYTALSGTTVRVSFDLQRARVACGMVFVRPTRLLDLRVPMVTIENDTGRQMLGVLSSVRTWNIRDTKPTQKVWYERVPVDVAEGVARAIVLASKR